MFVSRFGSELQRLAPFFPKFGCGRKIVLVQVTFSPKKDIKPFI